MDFKAYTPIQCPFTGQLKSVGVVLRVKTSNATKGIISLTEDHEPNCDDCYHNL